MLARNGATMRVPWSFALVLFAISPQVHAVEVAGVKLADTATVGGQPTVLNGAGVRKKLMFDVYVGSLYTHKEATTLAEVMGGTRRVQMNMLRELNAESLLEALEDGLRDNNSAAELAAVKAETEKLATIMKSLGDLKAGNIVSLDYADGATTVTLNGKARGSIGGEAFNKAVLKIWLGPKPVQDDLKKKLLGQ
jgi:long-chain acyl-CoA synthetase